MIDTRATFTGAIPENYDRLLGPAWFGAFAKDLAEWVPAQPGGDVLEIACGTGLVTGYLRERLDPSARLVATDLNKPMLDYAGQRLSRHGKIEFREADAMKLPFPDAHFAAAVCGFGFMFMPDKAASFREVHRVLAPRGRLFFSVWDRIEACPTNRVAAELIEGLFPGDDDVKFRVPFVMHDVEALRKLLASTGFEEIRLETRNHAVRGDPRTIASGQIKGTPRSLLLEKKGASLDDIVDRLATALGKFGGNPYESSAQAHLVEVRAV